MTRLPAPPLPPWLAALVPFDRYRVEVHGRRLHVMEAGRADGPPVVLLHGNPTWGVLYRRVVAGTGLRLVMPDLLGLGFSDKPRDPAEHDLERHARLFGGLLDALGLDRMVFVGQDWGGPIGVRALADRPDRLAGVVVLNTVLGPPRPGFRPTAFHRFARMPVASTIAFRLLGFPQNALGRAQGDPSSIAGDVARAYRYPLRRLRDNLAPLALARMVPDSASHPSIAPLQRCESFMAAFDGPAAIVWGDRDPILGRLLGRTERLLPRARVTRTRAGHFLQEEVPDEIAEAIRFVASGAGLA